MKKTIGMAGLVCLALAGYALAGGKPVANAKQIARGEYLVKGIGQCGDCHSPMDEHGQFVQGKWLYGTKLGFGPLTPMPMWADTSPRLAGLPGWDREAAIQFLMTGMAPNGQPARPPMPAYHMNRADAEAVVAYLQSLK